MTFDLGLESAVVHYLMRLVDISDICSRVLWGHDLCFGAKSLSEVCNLLYLIHCLAKGRGQLARHESYTSDPVMKPSRY